MKTQDFAKKLTLLGVFLRNLEIKSNNEEPSIPKKATVCNSVYVGQELLQLPFDYQFSGFGRHGVISSDLCADYDDIPHYRVSRRHLEKESMGHVTRVANFLSSFVDHELAQTAQLLWNEGAFLDETEKLKANDIRTAILTQAPGIVLQSARFGS
jgi:hypothetical protein